MRRRSQRVLWVFSVAFLLLSLFPVVGALAQGYDALNGVKNVEAVFDMRIGDAESALDHLKLIEQTFEDKNLTEISMPAEFVVVFIGPSVKLLSRNSSGQPSEEAGLMKSIAETLSEMSNKGIRLEVCMVAVKYFEVDPASILPEIKKVGNGYISLLGYQAKGYSLVPVY